MSNVRLPHWGTLGRSAFALWAALLCLGASPSAAQAEEPRVARDKWLHFGVSASLAAGSYAVAWSAFDCRWQRVALSSGLTLALGGGKELLDLAGLGDPSWRDFAWDALGTATGVFVAWLLDVLLTNDRCPPRKEAHGEGASAECRRSAAAPAGLLLWRWKAL